MLKYVGAAVVGGVVTLLVSRLNYRRQRHDLLTDKQREADRDRLAPLIEAVNELEPYIREVKVMIDDAANTEGGIGPFLSSHRERGRDSGSVWILDLHYNEIEKHLGLAVIWVHEHTPELAEHELPDEVRELDALWKRFIESRHKEEDELYKATLLGVYEIIAPLRDRLRRRFRLVPLLKA